MEHRGAKRVKDLETIIVSKETSIATITLNRPEKLNALSPDVMADFDEALDDAIRDKSIRAVIITGAGKSFSAGGDVKEDLDPLRILSPDEFNSYLRNAMESFKRMMYADKPIIAAINGYAVGAGMELALACDIRIAAEDAKMGEFFVKMGIAPDIGLYILPRLVGLGRAKSIAMLGEAINATDAQKMGLVDMVVPPDKLISSAEELARKLASGPKAIGIIKKAIMDSLTMSLEQALEYTILLQYQLFHTEDHQEAIKAFLEKRSPAFKGK